MHVTSLGHAGFRIDTRGLSVPCVNPADFSSSLHSDDTSDANWDLTRLDVVEGTTMTGNLPAGRCTLDTGRRLTSPGHHARYGKI